MSSRSKSTRSPARNKGWRSAPPAYGGKRSVSAAVSGATEGGTAFGGANRREAPVGRQISGNIRSLESIKKNTSFHKNFVFNPNSTNISRHEFLRNVRKMLGIKIAKWRDFDPDNPNDPEYVKDFLKVFAKGELFLLEDQSENGPHFNGRLVGPDPTYADLWVTADELMISDNTTLNRFIESFLLREEYRFVPIIEIKVIRLKSQKGPSVPKIELTKDEGEYLLKYFADSANPFNPFDFKDQGNPVILKCIDRTGVQYCNSLKDLINKIENALTTIEFKLVLTAMYPKLPTIRVWTDYRYEDTDDENN